MTGLRQGNLARKGAPGGGAALNCDDEVIDCRPSGSPVAVRMSELARTIEREIIPRLMLAHRVKVEPVAEPPGLSQSVTVEDVRQFAKLVLSHSEEDALARIRDLRARDVSVESLYLDLLAPTARYLGELWEEDLCNFTEVTVGLGRLHSVLRELSPALGQRLEQPTQCKRVLLLPCPGEQHTFGLVMVAEFFRRAGWDVSGGAWAAGADAAGIVNAEWFDAVGFSLGAETHLQALANSIAAVRQASRNRGVAVLVGGPIFAKQPGLVSAVGADGAAADGREAPALAEQLMVANLGRVINGG